MMLHTIPRAAMAAGAVLAFVAVGSPAQAAEETSDIRVSSSVDKQTVRLGETLTVTVTVRNAGPATAEGVVVRSEHENCIAWTTPALSESDGYDLPVGGSKSFTRSGQVTPCGVEWGKAEAFYFILAGNEPVNGYNFTNPRARVLGGRGVAHFAAVDAAGGQGVAGVTITMYDEFTDPATKAAEIRTGADGKAFLDDLTPGDYHAKVTAPAGWKVEDEDQIDLRVRLGEPVSTLIRLVSTGATPPPGGGSGTPPAEPSGAPTATPAGTTPPAGGTGGGDGGDLPITGANAAAAGAAGVALLILGGLAFVLTRRRRIRFSAGD
jgi:LPXTG-motif cell wall-anchored protein